MKSFVARGAVLAWLAALGGAGCLTNHPLDAICDDGSCAFSHEEWHRLQQLTNLGPPPRDLSNGVDGDPRAIALGQAFFNDARFSGPATQVDALRRPAGVPRAPLGQATNLSCASCHDLRRSGADTESIPGNVSSGAGWTDVNALAVVNCAYQRLYSWNGRADSLWAQAFAVAESPTTMNGNRLHTFHVLLDNYSDAYDGVFGWKMAPLAFYPPEDARFPANGKPGAKPGCQAGDASEPFGDAWDCMESANQDIVTYVLVNWAKALAAYEATLTSRNSAFDVLMREGAGSSAVSAAAKRGARLFVGKAGCFDCHNTPLLSDGDFHNVGVPQEGPAVPTEADCPAGGVCDCVTAPAGKNCLPWGALDGLTKLQASKVLRSSQYSDDPGDRSRADELTRPLTDALIGAWRTPTLRNVALTGPYMHDGIYSTLEDVVAHYNRGGDLGAPGVRAVQIRPLGLTVGEQADLVAFLETLTEISAPTPGAGGTTASLPDAGGPGTTTGGGPSTPTGGSSGGGPPPRPVCQGVPPASSVIALGYPSSPATMLYTFSAPGLMVPNATADPAGWQVVWSPGSVVDPTLAYAGVGIAFGNPPCVDARAYTGVSFTVTGSLGACSLQFGVVPSEDNDVANGPVGTCTAGAMCVPPASAPIGVGTTVVRFSEMTGGSPLATPDPASLNGVQWVLTAPTAGPAVCTASFRISNVSFVSDSGGSFYDASGPFDAMPPPRPCPPGLADQVPTARCVSEGLSCIVNPPGDGGTCPQVLRCVSGLWTPQPCPQ